MIADCLTEFAGSECLEAGGWGRGHSDGGERLRLTGAGTNLQNCDSFLVRTEEQ